MTFLDEAWYKEKYMYDVSDIVSVSVFRKEYSFQLTLIALQFYSFSDCHQSTNKNETTKQKKMYQNQK
jgi:hypothetical protein